MSISSMMKLHQVGQRQLGRFLLSHVLWNNHMRGIRSQLKVATYSLGEVDWRGLEVGVVLKLRKKTMALRLAYIPLSTRFQKGGNGGMNNPNHVTWYDSEIVEKKYLVSL